MYNPETINIIQFIFLILLGIAIVIMFIYFIFFDKTDKHDVEIKNIYKRLEDNSKMETVLIRILILIR